jgi:AcrR family transcriptional regulator
VAEWIAALATSGAAALVGAAATDTWGMARTGFTRLFGGGDQRRRELAEEELDGLAAKVTGAKLADRDRVREEVLPAWQARLADLLDKHPEAREELRGLAETVRGQLPTTQQAWVQTNIARDHSTQYIVQHGTIHIQGGGAAERR